MISVLFYFFRTKKTERKKKNLKYTTRLPNSVRKTLKKESFICFVRSSQKKVYLRIIRVLSPSIRIFVVLYVLFLALRPKKRIRCHKKLGQSFILRKQPRQTLSYTKQKNDVKSTWIFMAPNVTVWVKESHNTTGRGNKSITPQYWFKRVYVSTYTHRPGKDSKTHIKILSCDRKTI